MRILAIILIASIIITAMVLSSIYIKDIGTEAAIDVSSIMTGTMLIYKIGKEE